MPNIFTLIEAGYAVVYQDCRGTFRSGGEFIPMLNEASDGADTVAWLLEQPWCDGNIGTFGPSYLGFVQWASASASSPLKAIAPAVTTTDYYTTPWYSEGGALSLHAIQSWTTLMALAEAQRALAAGSGDPQALMDLMGWPSTRTRTSRRCPSGSGRCWRSSGRGGPRSSPIPPVTSSGVTCRSPTGSRTSPCPR